MIYDEKLRKDVKNKTSNELKLARGLFSRALWWKDKGGCYAQKIIFDMAEEHFRIAKCLYQACIDNDLDVSEFNLNYIEAERAKHAVLALFN